MSNWYDYWPLVLLVYYINVAYVDKLSIEYIIYTMSLNICLLSSYQNGPDTYLLQLRDTQFPVRLREYMKVACNRSPGYSLNVFDTYDPRVRL